MGRRGNHRPPRDSTLFNIQSPDSYWGLKHALWFLGERTPGSCLPAAEDETSAAVWPAGSAYGRDSQPFELSHDTGMCVAAMPPLCAAPWAAV